MRRFVAIALMTIACNGGPAGHSQTQIVSLVYKQGTTYHYTVHMTIDLSVESAIGTDQMKYDITAKETATVNAVDPSGVADMAVTLTDISMTSTLGSSPTTSTTGSTAPTTTFKIAADGQAPRPTPPPPSPPPPPSLTP